MKRDTFNRNIQEINIGDLCTSVVQIYGANIKIMRQIANVVDGLRPVDRRVLYGMYLKQAFHNEAFKKSASIMGTVAEYHPHGDTPIYDTMVRLSQPWNNLQPLVEIDGNNGTNQGNPAAAYRYTKARMTHYAYKCFFEDFVISMANTRESYKGDDVEPEFFPSRYPNILINNTYGIGYGVSSGLPTFNLREVLELTIKLINDPNHPDVTLYPDSPTWADIVDDGNFKSICELGEGKFRMRGEILVDESDNSLRVRSTPMQVYFNTVKDAILELQEKGKIRGVLDFKSIGKYNTDSPSGLDVRIILKNEIDPYVIRDAIYSSNKTRMLRSFPVNFKLIDDYNDVDYNIRSLILTWIEYRRDYKRRFFNNKLIKAKERLHILETILMIFTGKNGEKAVQVIKSSESRKETVEYLRKTFGISSLQASQIAEMRLLSFNKESLKRYEKETEKLHKTIKELDKIIRSNSKIDKIIIEELEEGIALFGTDRRSRIITLDGETKVRDSEHILVFTSEGRIKKLPSDIANIGTLNQGDHPVEIMSRVSNLSDIMIFDDKGNVFKIPVSEIKNSEMGFGGEPLTNYRKISGKVTAILRKPDEAAIAEIKIPLYLLMVTKKGIIKKTLVSRYENIKNELLAIVIKDDDELMSVKLLAGDKDILVYTNKGMGVRFSSETVKETKRMSIGVKALDLSTDEYVVGMDIVGGKDEKMFALTNKGTGKLSSFETFQTMDRASRPLRIISLEDDEEVVLIRAVKGTEKFVVFLKNSIENIGLDNVPELPRLSKGKKLIPVPKGNSIIDIKEDK